MVIKFGKLLGVTFVIYMDAEENNKLYVFEWHSWVDLVAYQQMFDWGCWEG
jgi:hypothetical protein